MHEAVDEPLEEALAARVRAAARDGTPLRIVGGGTRDWYGAPTVATAELSLADCRGILSHTPSELVLTARAGTPLREVEAALAAHAQMLPFEPPRSGAGTTVGGMVACGLAGPARPYRGSVRDHVLGVALINGRGERLRFGGEVMKNVAGYDISRLQVGALGVLGVLTAVSLRVVPRPGVERTLQWRCAPDAAATRARDLARRPWPVSAVAWDTEILRVRLSGNLRAVEDAERRLGAESVVDDSAYWCALRDYALPAFTPPPGQALWRLSVPPAAPLAMPGVMRLCDWGGAQRWCVGAHDDPAFAAYAQAHGGHATRFRGTGGGSDVFSAPAARDLLERIKRAFDPARILNPGRLYAWL